MILSPEGCSALYCASHTRVMRLGLHPSCATLTIDALCTPV